jgi:hypothetical protein
MIKKKILNASVSSATALSACLILAIVGVVIGKIIIEGS